MGLDDIFKKVNRMMDELEDELEDMEGKMDDVDESPFGNSPFGDGGPFGGGTFDKSSSSPDGLEVYNEDGEVVVVADLPGFEPGNIDITVDEERVRVSAEATDEMRRESRTNAVSLPEPVREDEVEASFDNGVLTVELPKQDADDDDDDDDTTSITIS